MMNLRIQHLEIKKWQNPNEIKFKIKFKYKVRWNSYLGVPDIIDYKLVQDSEIQNNGSNRLDEIHRYTEVFAVADRETRHVTIP